MAKGENSKVKDSAETDASVEPEVPIEVAAEDPVEEQNNEVEEEVDVEETVEGAESDVRKTRCRKRNKRRRSKRRKGGSSSAPESSREERTQTEISGLISMCNISTKKNCFKHRVFGFPEAKKDVVKQVKKGMKLFLFDVDRKVLYGIYKASSEGGMNLVPEAFNESERKYPAQVRFDIHKDCMPLEQNDFKQAIKENYYGGNKFKSELTYEQVGKLMRLFRPLDFRGLPQPRSRSDAQREPASRDIRRESASRSSSRGPSRAPRTGGTLIPHVGSARHLSQPAREPVYAREYSSSYYTRSHEHVPTELDLRTQSNYIRSERVPTELNLRTQSNYIVPAYSQATLAEAEGARYVRLQEVETDAVRRAYANIPPTGAGILGARQGYLDELHIVEQQSFVPRRPPLLHDPLYRGAEYQREMPYSSYGGLRNPGFPY